MPYYRRAHIPGGACFFTVNLRDRRRQLLVDQIDHLRASFRAVRARLPFRIDAIVVLPEHLHCVWTLPPNDADYSTRWRLIKTRFGRAISQSDFWQPRFWEHSIGNERDLIAHLDYIHFNPVRHGHVTKAIDWPYSTFHRYVAAKMYDEDWAASPAVQATNHE